MSQRYGWNKPPTVHQLRKGTIRRPAYTLEEGGSMGGMTLHLNDEALDEVLNGLGWALDQGMIDPVGEWLKADIEILHRAHDADERRRAAKQTKMPGLNGGGRFWFDWLIAKFPVTKKWGGIGALPEIKR